MPKSLVRRFTKNFFILCNGIAAIFFFLSSYGYLFNPNVFWPIEFISLGAFYFLILLLIFLIFWLFVKPIWSLISIIVLLIAIKPIKQVIPLRFSSSFEKQKKQPNSLRVMSWNVAQFDVLNYKKHPEVKNQMLDIVNDYKPDIACFQEMVCADSPLDTSAYIKNYYHKYSYYTLNDFADKLQFPFNLYSYNKAKEDFLENQHFGILIFSKYPLFNKQTISFYPNNYNSIFQYADFVKDNDTFRLFNIHLQSLKFSNKNLKYLDKPELEDEEGVKQSKSIFAKIKMGVLKRKTQSDHIRDEIEKSPYPVIICGDFNDVPNSYAYHTIGKGFKNAFAEKGYGLGRTFSAISPTLRIDNIFVDDKFDVLQFTRINKKLSDHFPIITDIQFKK